MNDSLASQTKRTIFEGKRRKKKKRKTKNMNTSKRTSSFENPIQKNPLYHNNSSIQLHSLRSQSTKSSRPTRPKASRSTQDWPRSRVLACRGCKTDASANANRKTDLCLGTECLSAPDAAQASTQDSQWKSKRTPQESDLHAEFAKKNPDPPAEQVHAQPDLQLALQRFRRASSQRSPTRTHLCSVAQKEEKFCSKNAIASSTRQQTLDDTLPEQTRFSD
jgi:hypothetical protein